MDCPPQGPHAEPPGPASWEAGGRAIDAFCTRVLTAGFAPTLFVTPEAAAQHAPLCDDFAGRGADVGLLIQPPTLRGAGYHHYLGAYPPDQQREIVREAMRRLEAALGWRSRSARSAMYSASDETFAVLNEAGFRQTSLSSPGRQTPKFNAVWAGAATETHFASAANRLAAGSLSLLEVPVTTDATQRRGGIAPDLAIENGTVERWHAPLVEGQLARQEAEGAAFRTLCFVTTSRYGYHEPSTRFRQTLDGLLDYLRALDERYDVVPVTLAEAYAHYRQERE